MTVIVSSYAEYEAARDANKGFRLDLRIPSVVLYDWSLAYEQRVAGGEDAKKYIVDAALGIVTGDRRTAYGGPEDSFDAIARYWTAYLQNHGHDVTLTARDVSPMMRLLKEARLDGDPGHLDSMVDLVGYVLTGAEVNGVKISVDP